MMMRSFSTPSTRLFPFWLAETEMKEGKYLVLFIPQQRLLIYYFHPPFRLHQAKGEKQNKNALQSWRVCFQTGRWTRSNFFCILRKQIELKSTFFDLLYSEKTAERWKEEERSLFHLIQQIFSHSSSFIFVLHFDFY